MQYTKGLESAKTWSRSFIHHNHITGGAETVLKQSRHVFDRYLSHLDPEGLPGGLAVDLVQHGGELAPRTALVHARHQLGLGVLAEDLSHALLPLDGGADLFG